MGLVGKVFVFLWLIVSGLSASSVSIARRDSRLPDYQILIVSSMRSVRFA
jgi:hypothetical protein